LGVLAPNNAREFFAGFNEAQLDPEFQWPMNSAQSATVEPQHGGYLLLTPARQTAPLDEWTGAVLGLRVTSGDYVATVALDATSLQPGARAGLAAYSWRDAAVGIAADREHVYVWRREGQTQETLATGNAPNAPALYLRMTVAGGETYRFAASANGRDWTNVGASINANYIEGAHVALTAAGRAGAPARFDWLRVALAKQP
jgi:hypothetical protein